MNYLSRNPEFQKTKLYQTFRKQPLGFVDIGSLGEIHHLVHPISSLVHALCFELNENGCEELRQKYQGDKSFAKVTVCQTALASKTSHQKLYITKVPTNTSLLQPNADFIRRYQAEKFEVEKVISASTQALDSILFGKSVFENERMGEFIKLDTQGSEHDILMGAKRTLKERCLGVWCEVEFFEVYRKQKTFSDIDRFLRNYGLFLYGLYPHYRSNKALDRKEFASEERMMWADALFLKDPLDERNKKRNFSGRDISVLILIAITARFYNFALELIQHYYEGGDGREILERLVGRLAVVDQGVLLNEVTALGEHCRHEPGKVNLFVGKFVDAHRSNSSIDYLSI